MFLRVEEEPEITVVKRDKNSQYVRRQRKQGKGAILDICTRKICIDGIHGIDQVVGEEAGKANEEEEHPGWPHVLKV